VRNAGQRASPRFALIFTLILLAGGMPLAENIDPASDGSKYAWADNVGWINLQPNGPGGPGVQVSDAALTGWAWAENAGWISLSCQNTSSCSTNAYGVTNNGSGTLSGYAWSENAGWITFAPTGAGVFIDPSNGDWSGMAWGENIGWITFASTGPNPFKVMTGWRCPDNDNDFVRVCAGDCNDTDASVHPGATETCDGRDNDCDGVLDEGCDAVCDNPEKVSADVRVTNAVSDSVYPSLVWTGSEYGVSWHDSRDGNNEIYFARLDASGNKIGADVRVTTDVSYSQSPSLVWTGSGYGVSWQDYRDGSDEIYFTRLDASGAKIGSDVRVTNDSAGSLYPSLVWTGSEYGMSWADNRGGNYEIYFARLDASGSKIGSDVRVTNYIATSMRPSLVWTGSEYGVSWYDIRDGNAEIYFGRLDASGSKIGSDVRVTDYDTLSSAFPRLAWTGSEYGLSWRDTRDGNSEIYFVRIGASGTKIGSDMRVTNAALDSVYPSLVWTGSEYGVSWYDSRDGNNEIYVARLNASGNKIGSDVRVTNSVGNSLYPSLVWTGTDYGVSWYNTRDGNSEIYFARLSCCDNVDGDGYNECHECDDAHASVYPGAPQLCDVLNNDCNAPGWPSLVGTNEADDDGDGLSECAGDCDDADGTAWAIPGEARGLSFASGKTTFSWNPPVVPGGSVSYYDSVRSSMASDFVTGASCAETNGTDTQTIDAETPPIGGRFFYNVRSGNSCGEGSPGRNSDGTERTVRACP